MKPVRVRVVSAVAIVALALLACKKDKKEESTGSSSAAASGDKTGVPECDEYLTKYEACLKEKVPAAARPQMEESFKTQRDTFKKLAANPVTKGTMAQSCKQALETAKTAMGSYNCSW